MKKIQIGDVALKQVIIKLVALLVLVSAAGCTSLNPQVSRVSLDSKVHEQDFRTACQKMARSLVRIPQISNAQQPPSIAIVGVENRTTKYIDKDIYLEKMRTILLQNTYGKMTFIDRKLIDSIQQERMQKREGNLTSSKEETLMGADFFLTGKIFSDTIIENGNRFDFVRYSFRLTDAETSAIVWEDEYESQVLNQKALMNR
jgi:penicillin-binding protein activator